MRCSFYVEFPIVINNFCRNNLDIILLDDLEMKPFFLPFSEKMALSLNLEGLEPKCLRGSCLLRHFTAMRNCLKTLRIEEKAILSIKQTHTHIIVRFEFVRILKDKVISNPKRFQA